jgi:hypothetical protein
MFKRVFFVVSMFLLSISAFSQTQNANPNAEHDRMVELLMKSYGVALPDSITNKLKAFAREKNFPEREVMKNSVFLRALYNETISVTDRIYACEFTIRAINNSTNGMMLPIKLFNDRYTQLNILNKQSQKQ